MTKKHTNLFSSSGAASGRVNGVNFHLLFALEGEEAFPIRTMKCCIVVLLALGEKTLLQRSEGLCKILKAHFWPQKAHPRPDRVHANPMRVHPKPEMVSRNKVGKNRSVFAFGEEPSQPALDMQPVARALAAPMSSTMHRRSITGLNSRFSTNLGSERCMKAIARHRFSLSVL